MGICKYKWWLGLGWFVMKEGMGWAKKNRNFSCARAFLECLVVMHGIVHVTPRTAVAKKNPLTQKKKQKERKGDGDGRRARHGARC